MTSPFVLLLLLNFAVILSALQESPELKFANEQNNHDVQDHPQNVGNKLNLNNSPNSITISEKNINLKNISALKNGPMNKTNVTVLNVVPNHENSSKTANNVSWSNVEQESGLLTKGMMLLLIVSLFFIMFVAYKTYRRKSRYARIQKYGVRLARGNVEMRPLPLDNDDEDETIFDLKNVPT